MFFDGGKTGLAALAVVPMFSKLLLFEVLLLLDSLVLTVDELLAVVTVDESLVLVEVLVTVESLFVSEGCLCWLSVVALWSCSCWSLSMLSFW